MPCNCTQVGRAGRDGREGRCVALLDDSDYLLLRALAHGSMVQPASVQQFLSTHVFGDEWAATGGGASTVSGKRGRNGDTAAASAAQAAATAAAAAEAAASVHQQQGGACRAAPGAALTTCLDAPGEVLESILSFLQAEEWPALQAMPHSAASVEVRFHR